jgi:hypothetical protein
VVVPRSICPVDGLLVALPSFMDQIVVQKTLEGRKHQIIVMGKKKGEKICGFHFKRFKFLKRTTAFFGWTTMTKRKMQRPFCHNETARTFFGKWFKKRRNNRRRYFIAIVVESCRASYNDGSWSKVILTKTMHRGSIQKTFHDSVNQERRRATE